MSIANQINEDLKSAMKAKDKPKLEALRAIKSALLLAATEKGAGDSSEAAEMKMLQKLVKQRKDSADIFHKEGRTDLAGSEEVQIAFIEKYLPAQMSEDEIEVIVQDIVAQTGAEGMKDMGKVMGAANQKMAGKADSGKIAKFVKAALAG